MEGEGSTVAMMPPSDVVNVLGSLEAAAIPVWLEGGWGVDALLGEQTRPHDDLDLIARVDDEIALGRVLTDQGYDRVAGGTDSNYVVRDARRRQIDLHFVRFDEDGNGIYRMDNGEDWSFPASGFEGIGWISGREVRCLTPDVQMLCHADGYPPGATDFHDMRLLNARFGTRLVPPFDD